MSSKFRHHYEVIEEVVTLVFLRDDSSSIALSYGPIHSEGNQS